MADESSQTEQVARAFNVVEVPTFIFMRSGKEVARHVGSSRGDLIGKILQVGVLTAATMHAVRGVLERALHRCMVAGCRHMHLCLRAQGTA